MCAERDIAAEYTDCVFVAYLDDVTVLGPPARAYAALQRLQSLAESQCDLESDMSKCGVFSPAATDAEMDFIPASIEGSPHYVGDKHAGRLRGIGAFDEICAKCPAARPRCEGRGHAASSGRFRLAQRCLRLTGVVPVRACRR